MMDSKEKKPSGLAVVMALGKKKESDESEMDKEMDKMNPSKLLSKIMSAEDGKDRNEMIDELIDHLQAMKGEGQASPEEEDEMD